MSHAVLVPALGSDQTVWIEQWYKVAGDTVAAGEPLLLVRSSQVALDLPAPVAGQLGALAIAAGEQASVGQTLVEIGGDGASAASSAPVARLRSTPLVRKIAAVHGLDLTSVQPSGRGGRIVRLDLAQLVPAAAPRQPVAPPTPLAVAAPVASTMPVAATPRAPQAGPLPQLPAQTDAPTALTAIELALDGVLALCAREARRARRGVVLTPAVCVAHAASETLIQHRRLNATWSEEGPLLYQRIDLGIVEDREQAVVVDAAALSLQGLARATQTPAAVAPTFSILLAATDWREATLAPGQAATIVLSPAQRRAVVVSDAAGDHVCPRMISLLTLAYDARLIAQPEADAFLQALKQRVEALG